MKFVFFLWSRKGNTEIVLSTSSLCQSLSSSPAVVVNGGISSRLRSSAPGSEHEDPSVAAAAAFGLDEPPDPPFVFLRRACLGIAGKSPLSDSLPPLPTDARESLFGRRRRNPSNASSMAPVDWFRRERRCMDPSPRGGAFFVTKSAPSFSFHG